MKYEYSNYSEFFYLISEMSIQTTERSTFGKKRKMSWAVCRPPGMTGHSRQHSHNRAPFSQHSHNQAPFSQ